MILISCFNDICGGDFVLSRYLLILYNVNMPLAREEIGSGKACSRVRKYIMYISLWDHF